MRAPRLHSILAALAFFVLAGALHAHPIHTSYAEADYNRTTKKLEVSLRVFADDFEAALGELAGKKVSFEKTPRADLDTLVRAYLINHFLVKRADGTLAPQRLIGHELKDAANEYWLYFETDLPAGLEGLRLHDTIMRDRFPDQLNSVRVRDAQRETTLVFLPKHNEQPVRFSP